MRPLRGESGLKQGDEARYRILNIGVGVLFRAGCRKRAVYVGAIPRCFSLGNRSGLLCESNEKRPPVEEMRQGCRISAMRGDVALRPSIALASNRRWGALDNLCMVCRKPADECGHCRCVDSARC